MQIYNKISLNLNLKKIILFILFLKKNKIIRQTNFFFFLFSNLLKKNINFYFILFFLSYSYNNFKKNKNKNFFLKKKKYKKVKRLKNKKFHYKKNKNLLNFIKNTSYFFIKKYYIKIFFNKFKSVWLFNLLLRKKFKKKFKKKKWRFFKKIKRKAFLKKKNFYFKLKLFLKIKQIQARKKRKTIKFKKLFFKRYKLLKTATIRKLKKKIYIKKRKNFLKVKLKQKKNMYSLLLRNSNFFLKKKTIFLKKENFNFFLFFLPVNLILKKKCIIFLKLKLNVINLQKIIIQKNIEINSSLKLKIKKLKKLIFKKLKRNKKRKKYIQSWWLWKIKKNIFFKLKKKIFILKKKQLKKKIFKLKIFKLHLQRKKFNFIFFKKKKKYISIKKHKTFLKKKNNILIIFFFFLKKLNNYLFLTKLLFLFNFFIPFTLYKHIYKYFKENFILKKKNYSLANTFTNSKLSFLSLIFNFKLKTKILNKKTKSFFFFFFLINFFEKKFNTKISLNFFSCNLILNTELFLKNWISKRIGFRLKKFHKNFYFSEFLNILILCLKLKNLTMFTRWFKTFFEKIHFKFHKQFLKKINFFFYKFFNIFKKKFKIKGFFLDVRGKLSVAGNSKKRHFFIKYGKLSKSTKTLKFFHAQNQVRTPTGVLGIVYMLTY